MAGRFHQCWSEMKIAVVPVYKYMLENPLKLPPTFRIFLFGLVSRMKAVSEGRLARQQGAPCTQNINKSYWMVSPVICFHSCLHINQGS